MHHEVIPEERHDIAWVTWVRHGGVIRAHIRRPASESIISKVNAADVVDAIVIEGRVGAERPIPQVIARDSRSGFEIIRGGKPVQVRIRRVAISEETERTVGVLSARRRNVVTVTGINASTPGDRVGYFIVNRSIGGGLLLFTAGVQGLFSACICGIC